MPTSATESSIPSACLRDLRDFSFSHLFYFNYKSDCKIGIYLNYIFIYVNHARVILTSQAKVLICGRL